MRSHLSYLVPLVLFLPLSVPAQAAIKPADAVDNPELLLELQDEATHAKPREQCFMYTEVIQVLSELAGRDLANGDTDKAFVTLEQVRHYADLIHTALARDTHKLREAEKLMSFTTYRLGQCLRLVSSDDKEVVQATLLQLNRVNTELLTQVFQH